MSRLRIATRSSPLALAQAQAIGARLERELGVETELIPLKTSGDRLSQGSLAAVGGKGLFVKEIEEALLEGRADLAVHSSKDLPAESPPGLLLAAFPERADPRDALVGRRAGATVEALPRGARVGTGSLRRRSLLLSYRSDLEVCPLRGNVDTRLRKLESEELDAVVLACAGLERLGLGDRIDERLDPEWMVPAVGQGALALQVRAGEKLAQELLALDHEPTHTAVRAERAFLARLGGDCNVPIAGHARLVSDGRVRLRGLVASCDGRELVSADAEAGAAEPEAAGRHVAEELLGRGGAALLEAARRAAQP